MGRILSSCTNWTVCCLGELEISLFRVPFWNWILSSCTNWTVCCLGELAYLSCQGSFLELDSFFVAQVERLPRWWTAASFFGKCLNTCPLQLCNGRRVDVPDSGRPACWRVDFRDGRRHLSIRVPTL
ncbi:hypothetical protein CDD81_841 [Ophiocordyceps australis]|uniref:Uncharacterized protein n=1 Tax=Ophiocordyceps australis TaxID=1399860 RepID=A0A2C5X8C2_9HYPO|nr:hypothetical protein CDD81_841 [Ophiocordyceps australis]